MFCMVLVVSQCASRNCYQEPTWLSRPTHLQVIGVLLVSSSLILLFRSLKQTLADLAANCQGGPMLYELIEKTKESLTQCNLPHGQCMVCLAGFEHGQPFTRTPCYHYFHCQCLLRYITHCLAQLKSELEEAQRSNVYRHQPKEEQKQVRDHNDAMNLGLI